MTADSRRKESRYRVSDPTEVRVVVRTDDASDPIDAQLLDLSNNGIQLRAFGCLKFEQSIEVHVSARELQFDLVGSVKWLREADESSWFVGCRIEPELSEQTLTQLASMALLERRGGRRKEVRLEASVCGELERLCTPAVLRNLSEDGFGMATLESHDVGQRIRVQVRQLVGQAIDVSARVVWQLKTPDGFVCGCSILNRECFSQLNELADAQSATLSLSTPPPERARTLQTGHWVALAAVDLCAFVSLFAILIENDPAPGGPVAQKRSLPDAPEADRSGVPPATDEPLANTSTRDDSRSPVTVPVTRGERTETADQVKTWLDNVVGLSRELVDEPLQSPLAMAPDVSDHLLPYVAKSAAGDAKTPATSGNIRRDGATPSIRREPATAPQGLIADAAAKQNERAERVQKRPTEFRTWVDDTGRYRVVARVVAVSEGTVRLLKENGRFASVPLARLSPDDARYIQRWLQASD